MNPSFNDLRRSLDDVARHQVEPDPHTLLAGAETRAKAIGTRRTMSGWAAVATAVIAIGGASILLNGGDEPLGEIEPAVPDESYADGYGIVGGEPQPFMDGLRLLEAHTIEPGPGRIVTIDDVDEGEPLYAVAWCTDTAQEDSSEVSLQTGDDKVSIPCLDRFADVNDAQIATPVPTDDSYVISHPSGSAALIAFYDEPERGDYPFPRVDSSPFPAIGSGAVVIDSTTPSSGAGDIEAIPGGSAVYQAKVPITNEPAELTVEIHEPGQVLVAIDGVVLTNDGEALPRHDASTSQVWEVADPTLRGGYVAGFGPPRTTSFNLSKSQLSEQGIDVSDAEATVTVRALGFVEDSSWRVVYHPKGGTGAAQRAPLVPTSNAAFPSFAFGHQLVGTFDVPSDGVSRPLEWATDETDITWVVDCSDVTAGEDGQLSPTVGTVTTPTGVGALQCFFDDGWRPPLRSDDITGPASEVVSTQLTARATEENQPLSVAAYEPMAFEDFPFDDAPANENFEIPSDGEELGAGSVSRQTDIVTLADLDSDGGIIIDIPDSSANALYVTTEGKGRFWIESVDPSESAMTSSGQAVSPVVGTSMYGLEDYWTSWTLARTTWPIVAETDSGSQPEQVRLRVEGYDDGDFELRVFGRYAADAQP